jgi:hypothetical protein
MQDLFAFSKPILEITDLQNAMSFAPMDSNLTKLVEFRDLHPNPCRITVGSAANNLGFNPVF